jgi:gluconolactonase
LPINGGGALLHAAERAIMLDSLAVDADGWVSVARLGEGGIISVSPDGSEVTQLDIDDPLVTNICFGGDDLRTAFITASGTGRLLATDWPRQGLSLAFVA